MSPLGVWGGGLVCGVALWFQLEGAVADVEVVAEAAERYQADLVLIGRGSLAKFAGRLRTHEYSIIRDAPCPVLSI